MRLDTTATGSSGILLPAHIEGHSAGILSAAQQPAVLHLFFKGDHQLLSLKGAVKISSADTFCLQGTC
jgi:hypothetical protein